MALGGFASRVLVSPGKMIIIMLGGFRFVISEWTKQSLSPSRDELGRDNVDVFYHKDEDENFGNPEEVTIIPFFERMLRRMLKTDPGKRDYSEDNERRLQFQNKMLARVGRSKSKFFRLAYFSNR